MAREKKIPKRKKSKPGDFILAIIVLILVIFGIIMVFSASYYDALNEMNDPLYYLKRMLGWAAFGFSLLILTAVTPYRLYYKFAPVIMGVSVVLLLLLFTPLGSERNNAVRWLDFGAFTIMPGEIAKLAAIIFVAWFISKDPDRIRSFTRGVLPLLLLCGIYFVLIYMQPNLSTAITVCGIIVGMMFVAGVRWSHMGALCGLGVAGVMGLVLMDEDGYHMKRMLSFLDPFADQRGDGYQVVQSLLALGAGGAVGVGLGKSIQKALYLPEAQNDFIFAIIGEELGFIGCIGLLVCYLVFIWRGAMIAVKAPDMFGTMLASGVTIMVALQVIFNIAVVTSSMPPTGVALPFISYGGNALLLFMASTGILLNISRNIESEQ